MAQYRLLGARMQVKSMVGDRAFRDYIKDMDDKFFVMTFVPRKPFHSEPGHTSRKKIRGLHKLPILMVGNYVLTEQ